jgi:hypothetical protein
MHHRNVENVRLNEIGRREFIDNRPRLRIVEAM